LQLQGNFGWEGCSEGRGRKKFLQGSNGSGEVAGTASSSTNIACAADGTSGDDFDSNGSSDSETPNRQLSNTRHQANRNRKKSRELVRSARRAATAAAIVPVSRVSDEENDHSPDGATVKALDSGVCAWPLGPTCLQIPDECYWHCQLRRHKAVKLEQAATISHPPQEFSASLTVMALVGKYHCGHQPVVSSQAKQKAQLGQEVCQEARGRRVLQ